jgi:hypothetical protein
MERKVEYIADEPDRVGRFGTLKKGDVIKVDEQEYRGCIESTHKFKPVQSRQIGIDPEEEFIHHERPIASQHFDLRTICWNRGDCLRRLGRKPKKILMKIARAMTDVSGVTCDDDHRATRKHLSESIYAVADRHGWTTRS